MHNEDNNNMPAPGSGAPDAESAQRSAEQQPTKTLAEQLKEAHELLQAERLRNIELKRQNETNENNFRTQLAKAQSRANSGSEVAPNVGMQARSREMAIRAVNGLAFWNRMSLDQRLAAMSEAPASATELELAKRLFSGQASREATSYAAQNPQHYARLRLIAQELR